MLHILIHPHNNTKDRCSYYSHLSGENIEALRDSMIFFQGPYIRSRVQIGLRSLGGVLSVYSTWTFQGTEHTTLLGLLFRAIAGSGSFHPMSGSVLSLRVASWRPYLPSQPQVSGSLASLSDRWCELFVFPRQKVGQEITTPHLCFLILYPKSCHFEMPKICCWFSRHLCYLSIGE